MKYIVVLLLTAAVGFPADFATGQAARLIIGQTNFTAEESGASDTLIGAIGGVAYANNMLFVADSNRVGASPVNNRVLIYPNVLGMLPLPTDELPYNQTCPVCVGRADVVLGQPDFSTTDAAIPATANGLRTPTAVASDGIHLAVADTDNNRVLIWNSIPTTNNQPADVVVGQTDFTSNASPNPPNAASLSGPQGVWFQDGKLFIADTHNQRVLIYNSIPTANGASADIVLGQSGFNVGISRNIVEITPNPQANTLLDPVSVTSDGQRLYVSDLGYNRVLIWNTIPTSNQAPADVVVGQPDMTSSFANNSTALCESTGTDANGNALYPSQCNATLSFPRYALSDGQRLFIADGGNDRVLVYSSVPTQNGQAADYIIGQLGGQINQASNAADSLRTPMSLAWDGTNLYVADTFNRRIAVYSPGENDIPYTGVRNAASREIFAVGSVTLSGSIRENDQFTITIAASASDQGKDYTYKIGANDTFDDVVNGLVALINAGSGDPNVSASANLPLEQVVLTARQSGADGNNVTLAISTSPSDATIVGTTSNATLAGGQDAAQIAPGTLVTIVGSNLADATAVAPPDDESLPTEMAGTEVYINGVRVPLLYVAPDQINAQMPWQFLDTTSVNAYVRVAHADGTVSATTPVAVTLVPANPGIFAEAGNDPRPGVVLHGSSSASATISVDGSAQAGDVATVTIADRTYTYTVTANDTLASIRDALVNLINQDPQVEAVPSSVFTRIQLKARVEGPSGNGIPYTATASDGAQVILTATNSTLCCANVAGALVTQDNPAVPGENILVYATGLGLPDPTDGVSTGVKYRGGPNQPQSSQFVSSLAGGKTANVLFAGLKPGMIGVWEVDLELNSDIPTNPQTELTIAQSLYVSNIVTFPVVNPNPPTP